MTTQILEIDSLRKTYGKGNNQTKALNGITFQVMACLLYTSFTSGSILKKGYTQG